MPLKKNQSAPKTAEKESNYPSMQEGLGEELLNLLSDIVVEMRQTKENNIYGWNEVQENKMRQVMEYGRDVNTLLQKYAGLPLAEIKKREHLYRKAELSDDLLIESITGTTYNLSRYLPFQGYFPLFAKDEYDED